jgi:hypothetical protein
MDRDVCPSSSELRGTPSNTHEVALKRIGRYLKGTMNKVLVLRLSDTLYIDRYVDDDFTGLWPQENILDPTGVKSRTGFSICIANCPVIWSPKLQSEIATSTMESEYSAFSSTIRDLLPLLELLISLSHYISATGRHQSTFGQWSGAFSLPNLEPDSSTPRSKHYAVKLHWFRSKLDSDGPHPITVEKIPTEIQRAEHSSGRRYWNTECNIWMVAENALTH